MDYYDDDDGGDDFRVDTKASRFRPTQVDVAEEPEESQEVCIITIYIYYNDIHCFWKWFYMI